MNPTQAESRTNLSKSIFYREDHVRSISYEDGSERDTKQNRIIRVSLTLYRKYFDSISAPHAPTTPSPKFVSLIKLMRYLGC